MRKPTTRAHTRDYLFVLLGFLLAVAPSAAAREVEVPLQFDHAFIREALIAQVYTGPNGKAIIWDDGTGCGYLKLREPAVSAAPGPGGETAGGRIRLLTRGEARVGTPFGDQCLAPLQWDGFLEVFEQPTISPDQHVLSFHVVESNLYDANWKKGFVTGKLWDLVKERVHPRLEAVHIDMNVPLQDLRELLPLLIARGDSARIEAMLDSLHIAAAIATDAGVQTTLAFTVSDITPAGAPTPEPTLTTEELNRWQEAWQHWDAFLTFVVKQSGHDAAAQDLRQALTDVLLDSRFDILEALAPSTPGAPDPTRALFLKTWERLAPVARRLAAAQSGATALRYLSFITAGDALAALDQAGPDIGLDISADGLRRLARIIAPLSTEDPLAYDTAVDPELRQLFGFGPPLPPPDLSGASEDTAWWRGWLIPAPAWATAEQPASKTLEPWIPPEGEGFDSYLQRLRQVLDDAAAKALSAAQLPEEFRQLYQHVVLTTAWQESCWRQFVRAGGKITYMKSAIGSTGLMQVNEHVWRGLYDLRGLRWDIRYNARAGAEILLRYLRDYAIPRATSAPPPRTDFLARATYAVYNGGPGHLLRFLKKNLSQSLRRIDDLFWQKYQAIVKNDHSDLVRCLGGG